MNNHKEKILVVDDEAAVRRILETRLSMIGYQVITAADGEQALNVFTQENPDLIVLDVMMPHRDGYSVCEELRKHSDVPIIMLTALGDVADRITGLQMGADDYLLKPFSPKELEARISSILRRVNGHKVSDYMLNAGIIEVANLRIDTNKRQLKMGDKLLRLTNIEFELLQLLVNQAGIPISRAEILSRIWGYAPKKSSDLRVVDVHISRLRSKMEQDPRQPEYIMTDRGRGYLFRKITVLSNAS